MLGNTCGSLPDKGGVSCHCGGFSVSVMNEGFYLETACELQQGKECQVGDEEGGFGRLQQVRKK